MTEEKKEESKIKVEKVTEFRAGQKLFSSFGISKVKVTKGAEIICYEIPIQSTGISDLIDSFQDKAPQPPVKNELVKPDSEIGRELRLSKPQWLKIPDFGDANYLKEKGDHDARMGNAILLKGIAVQITDESGNPVENEDKKIEILKSMDMSGDQFQQIIKDIEALTKWSEEEKQHFFG